MLAEVFVEGDNATDGDIVFLKGSEKKERRSASNFYSVSESGTEAQLASAMVIERVLSSAMVMERVLSSAMVRERVLSSAMVMERVFSSAMAIEWVFSKSQDFDWVSLNELSSVVARKKGKL